jgi:peptidyl-tRNA hydrolase
MMVEEDLSQRQAEADPLVLYLIVPSTLGMSAGKVAAQCGHAVQMMVLAYGALERRGAAGEALTEAERGRLDDARAWLSGIYRKVVLSADVADWRAIKESLDGFLVKDIGLTEVPAGTETAIALWPMRKSERPRMIRRLRLL